jgi:hypothetical protein
MENHIQQFNNMAKVEYDGQTFPLDLAVTDKLVVLNPHSPPTPIDVDLKLRDIQSLIEVRTDERTEEPVECLQGWGT